jgi:hypothetical protein
MHNKGLLEVDIQKLQTQPLTDQELLLIQFLVQTWSGYTLTVGTKRIPSVSSVTKHTSSGLLQSSVT